MGQKVPDRARHRVSLDLFIDVAKNGVVQRKNLIEGLQIYSADASHVTVPVVLVSDHVLRNDEGKESENTFYTPVILGRVVPGMMAFNKAGATLEAASLLDGPARLAQSGAKKLSGFGEALGGLNSTIGGGGLNPKPKPPAAQTVGFGYRMAYTPAFAGRPQVFERRVLDKSDERVRKEMPDFSGNWYISVGAGALNPAHVIDNQISQVLPMLSGQVPGMDVLVEGVNTAAQYDAVAGLIADRDMLIYRGAPFLSVRTITPQTPRQARSSFDILQSGLRAFRRDASGWAAAPDLALRAGLAETAVEHDIIQTQADVLGGAAWRSAWNDLAGASDLAVAINRVAVRDTGLSSAQKELASADLRRGQIVAINAAGDGAWWRVDAVTGAAIGVDHMGRGGSGIHPDADPDRSRSVDRKLFPLRFDGDLQGARRRLQ